MMLGFVASQLHHQDHSYSTNVELINSNQTFPNKLCTIQDCINSNYNTPIEVTQRYFIKSNQLTSQPYMDVYINYLNKNKLTLSSTTKKLIGKIRNKCYSIPCPLKMAHPLQI
ncbi:hypothetical protein ACTFIZ_004887 [Dictyostelium cf. discoideum]